jgi:hypothetical protein
MISPDETLRIAQRRGFPYLMLAAKSTHEASTPLIRTELLSAPASSHYRSAFPLCPKFERLAVATS